MITYTRMPAVRDWDGSSYDRISGPMEELGREVLARLKLRGDEVVLDAGCGSGRITQALIDRLPRGRVIAVDGSPSMVQAARERLDPSRTPTAKALLDDADAGVPAARPTPPVDVRLADLLELELEEPVDAVFSTATFHWIADHRRLFGRLRAALRSGGRLVAQCGGEGNIDVLRSHASAVLTRAPYAEHFAGGRRGTTPQRSRPANACSRPASTRRSAGLSPHPSSRSTRGSSSRPSSCAPTCNCCPRTCANRSWTTCFSRWESP